MPLWICWIHSILAFGSGIRIRIQIQHFGAKYQPKLVKKKNLLPAPKSELLRGYENVLYGWYKYHKKKKNILKILLLIKKKPANFKEMFMTPGPGSGFIFFHGGCRIRIRIPIKMKWIIINIAYC